MDHRSDGHGGRPLENDWVRSDGYWRRARPAAHASGSEAVATLATTGRQDGAAGAGAHPQTEAVGLVPTAVVRLERALAQRIHSTRGAWLISPITGSCRASHASCGQPAPRTNDPVDCRGHAAPVDAGFDLPTVRAGCQQGQFGDRPWQGRAARLCVFGSDTPLAGDIAPASLWTTVDPQARKLLASMVPGNPNSTDRPSWPISGIPIAVAIFGRGNCGHKGPNRQLSAPFGVKSGQPSNIAQPVDKGVEPRDPGLRDGTAKEQERDRAWMQERTQVPTRQASSRSSGRASSTASLRTSGSG